MVLETSDPSLLSVSPDRTLVDTDTFADLLILCCPKREIVFPYQECKPVMTQDVYYIYNKAYFLVFPSYFIYSS